MPLQNIVNSPTSSSGWTPFNTVITSTGTSPTLGSGTVVNSYYLQEGKKLFLNMTLSQTSSGTAGSGNYLFSMPAGFTINTTITGLYTASAPYNFPCFGSSSAAIGTPIANVGNGSAVVFDSTRYLLFIFNAGNSNYFVNFNYFALSNPAVSYSANLIIPIN
jgi:hypothetical protein